MTQHARERERERERAQWHRRIDVMLGIRLLATLVQQRVRATAAGE